MIIMRKIKFARALVIKLSPAALAYKVTKLIKIN